MKSRTIFAFLLVLQLSAYALADYPSEIFNVDGSRISSKVLKDAVGILTVVYKNHNKPELKVFSLKNGQRAFEKTIEIKETIPVSSVAFFMLKEKPSRDLFVVVRYPITARSGKNLLIVYDSVRDRRAWVNIEELEKKSLDIYITWIDSIKVPSRDFVDVFHLLKSGKRKVYKEPRNDSKYIIREKKGWELFNVVDQKNGFVKLREFDYDRTGLVEEYCWVKIRDENGLLTIWFFSEDTC